MSTEKHILIASTAYLPFVGGAEVAVKELTDRLTDYRFTLVTARLSRSLPRREQLGRVSVWRVGVGIPLIDKLILAFFGHRALMHAAGAERPLCVWAIMASYGGLAAGRYAREAQVPLLLTLQEGDDRAHILRRARPVWRAFHALFTEAALVQCISQDLATWARSLGAREVVVVPNGVDINKFKVKNPKSQSDEGKIKIITTSRLVHKNAVDVLIRALALLPEHYTLTIVGDGPERSSCARLADELGVRKRVIFYGVIAPEKIPEILIQADIFARPSRSEGLGNSFLEAFATGIPTIGTAVGGIRDFLQHGHTGWVVPVDDAEALAAQIRYLADPAHIEERARVCRTARALIEEHYSWEGITRSFAPLFSNFV